MGKVYLGKCPKCNADVYAEENQQAVKCEYCGNVITKASAMGSNNANNETKNIANETKNIASGALTFILVALAFIIGTGAFITMRLIHNIKVRNANDIAVTYERPDDKREDISSTEDKKADNGREEVEHIGPEFDSEAHYVSDDLLTENEKQAIEDAQFFLGTTFYSKYQLMCQLAATYDPLYNQDEAQVAIEYLEAHDLVDWNHECAEAAQLYLDIYDGYTREELKTQLVNKVLRFTDEQAEYALNRMGYK
ncbi:hypothetical protein [Butyrivibrio sp. AE3004]|uniref:hypothetical protein n=1 Tax=Butyrivibrio sp. AE3004 TaxID=1506994 RepID=UPI000494B43A|nr:hypothetical protein [Butyrivibrio sp. AE3004]